MKKIIISGFGGQGVLSLGLFVSYSAMNMGLNTSWLPSYGPEMRGGTANCSVVYADSEIASPVIAHPDYLIAMNEPSLAKFEDGVVPGGTILVNSSITDKKVTRSDVRALYIPVDELAKKINPKGGNIIMLGILLHLFGNISQDAAKEAVRQVFQNKPDLIDINLKCLEFGQEYMRTHSPA